MIYWYTRCVCTIVCNRRENPAWIRLHEQAARYAVWWQRVPERILLRIVVLTYSLSIDPVMECNKLDSAWSYFVTVVPNGQRLRSILQSSDSFRPSLSLQSTLRHWSAVSGPQNVEQTAIWSYVCNVPIGFQATSEDLSLSPFMSVSVIGLFIWRLIFNIRTNFDLAIICYRLF